MYPLIGDFNPPKQSPANEDSHTKESSSFTLPAELSPLNLPQSRQPKNGDARVLVVEDNKFYLNLMLAYLKEKPLATLDSAENGCLAVEAVKNQDDDNRDIIFMGELLRASEFQYKD